MPILFHLICKGILVFILYSSCTIIRCLSTFLDYYVYYFAFPDNGEGALLGANRRVTRSCLP